MKYIAIDKLNSLIEAKLEDLGMSGSVWVGRSVLNELKEDIKSLQQEQPTMIQWTGNNLKEIIDFTGKSPKFEEWFSSWEEYENYVHVHNNILKLFCEDGSHYEVPVGAWIVKTPDGYNVPSVARFIYTKQEQSEMEKEVELLKDIEGDAVSYCFDHGINITPRQAKEFATHYLMLGHNEGYIKGRKDAYIPAKQLGLPSSLDKKLEIDLEKEIIRYQREDMDRDTTVADVARYFYELGINARK